MQPFMPEDRAWRCGGDPLRGSVRRTWNAGMISPTSAIVGMKLDTTVALLTDGRFSGASKGPAIGHISPEAAEGGNIALVEENDLIQVDIPGRILRIVGINGEEKIAGRGGSSAYRAQESVETEGEPL